MDLFSQFLIQTLFTIDILGYSINFTNGTLCMCFILFGILSLFFIGLYKVYIIPHRVQAGVEVIFNFIVNIAKENLGEKYYINHLPFISSIFLFVLLGNLIGMVPYFGFTITAHISVSLTLGLIVWFYSVFLGLYLHGYKFFKLFIPVGVPNYLIPIIFVIELIVFFFRPISLTIRLVANMMAGHILLKVFAYLVLMLTGGYLFMLSCVPFGIMMGLVLLEIFIAFIQAYIFLLLTVLYLKDAIYLH